jgi:hypothetical protein
MCQNPDDEGFISLRFGQLSARNLLNLQIQLITIEQQLEAFDKVSRQTHDVGLRRWETFEESVNHSYCENHLTTGAYKESHMI